MQTMRLGRNDVCRCGSGKKYKKCCLPRQSGAARIPTLRAPPSTPGAVPTIPLGDPHLEAFEHKDVVFVKDKGWTHERDLKPGDQYRLKGGGWETVMPERVIGTTHEHPFYSQERGWTPAGELRPGEMIRTEDGWVPVKSVEDTGRYETVYNLRVEDYHTYFVGAPEWGFAVWAHNAYDPVALSHAAAAADRGGLTVAGRSLVKHTARPGSPIPPVTGNPSAINAQAQSIVNRILHSPTAVDTARVHPRFGPIVDIVDSSTGHGVRYTGAGGFLHFLGI